MDATGQDRPPPATGPGQGASRLARAVLAALLALFSALALCGCAGSLPPGFTPPQSRVLLQDMPFHPQEDHQCGPASLAMVLNRLGDPASPEDIARAIYRKDLRGTVSLDLALYPRTRGFSTRFFRGAPGDVVAAVDSGQPLLVMVDEGFGGIRVLHYMVVVGYAPEGVLVNSGRRREQAMPWAEFLSAWKGADNWAMLTARKDKP